MWEFQYGQEAYDRKLNAILFLKKGWMILLAAILGAILFGSVYFIRFVLFAPKPEYKTQSMLYVDFVEGEDGPQYYTFNAAGWSGFVKTDIILDYALSYRAEMGKESTLFSKEELRESVSAGTDADYRIVDLYVTNKDPAIALEMAEAMEQAFILFAGDMRECEQIRVMTKAVKADRILAKDETVRVTIWGAILFGSLSFMGLMITIALDDSIYLPDQFEKRYGIPVLGALLAPRNRLEEEDREIDLENETLLGLKQSLADIEKIGFVTIDGKGRKVEEEGRHLKMLLQQMELEITDVMIKNIIRHAEYSTEFQAEQVAILVIPCGQRNGKRIEKAIHMLQKQDVKIAGTILLEVEETLLHRYYFHLFRKRN